MSITFVYGTRPEAIKIGAIVHALRSMGIEPELVCTQQHTDLLKGTPAETDLKDSISMEMPSRGETNNWTKAMGLKLIAHFRKTRPRLVCVQGDTMSALAGGLAARMCELKDLKLAHIEAGLRSHMLNEPWPEENYRRSLGRWADYHFAPTELAAGNLIAENVPRDGIFVTGNPIVSALARYSDAKPVEEPDNTVLITLHRRELLSQDPVFLFQLVRSIAETAGDWPHIQFLWPVHPNFEKHSELRSKSVPRNLKLIPPLTYECITRTLARSLGVVTDSGGLQEEAATLGVPCAVARNVSDRPESIALGIARLFPPSPESIRDALECIIHRELPRRPSQVYGTVDSAERIAAILASFGVHSVSEPAELA